MINAITPVFLIILLGFSTSYFKWVPSTTAKGVMTYIYWIAGPAIIFSAISHYQLSQFLIWKFWLAYALLFVCITAVAMLAFKNLCHTPTKATLTLAYSTTVKNTVTIGMPLLLSLVGNAAVIPVVISLLFFNCLAMPALIFIIESKNDNANLRNVITRTLKNPLVLASLAGIAFIFFHLSLPQPINATLSYLGASFMPCALFAVGSDLKTYSFKNNTKKILIACFLNLILAPVAAILISYALRLSAYHSIILVILAATPTAQIMYAYVSQYTDLEQDVAAIVSATTLFSLITLPLFALICFQLWM